MNPYAPSLAYALATRLTALLAVDAWPMNDGHSSERWSVLAGALSSSRTWIENCLTRRRLLRCQMLDRRFAKDIALAPEEIAAECAKPFWSDLALSRPGIVARGRQ